MDKIKNMEKKMVNVTFINSDYVNNKSFTQNHSKNENR